MIVHGGTISLFPLLGIFWFRGIAQIADAFMTMHCNQMFGQFTGSFVIFQSDRRKMVMKNRDFNDRTGAFCLQCLKDLVL